MSHGIAGDDLGDKGRRLAERGAEFLMAAVHFLFDVTKASPAIAQIQNRLPGFSPR